MEKTSFIHKVSKGSRFNQIYVPKEMKTCFEAGDLVEVTLLNKKTHLFYSKNLKNLNRFKENLIKEIFSLLSQFKEIKQIFVTGSFLTQKSDYNDIDIMLISEKNLEEKVYKELDKKLELKFHVISLPEKSIEYLQKTCPLTRSMLYFFVSNKKFILSNKTELDKKHIKFLLMMPEDLLNLNLNPRVYYDSLRRLIAIEKFLRNQDSNPTGIDWELIKLIKESLYKKIKSNEIIDFNSIKSLKKIIKSKLNNIYKKLK